MPKVKYNGGIYTDGDYPDLKIWQTNPDSHKILFEFRMTSKMISQDENREFMPDVFPNRYQEDNIADLEQITTIPLFAEFFKKRKDVEFNDCYNLQCMRRIEMYGKLRFEFMLDVTFDTPEAFLEERSIKMMQEVTRIFFDIAFKIQNLK